MGELELETVVPDGIDAADITLELAAALAPDVGRIVMGQRAVLLEPASGDSHLLDGTATLVLQCLDGESRLSEITADLASEFGIDQQAIDADVLTMVRGLGEAGLLRGVRSARADHVDHAEPAGVPVGSDVSGWGDWAAAQSVSASGLTVLIHWGTHCGFCTTIAAELGELRAPLAAAGAGIVLVTTGGADALADQLGEVSLPALHVTTPPDFFGAVGTPSAYVVDHAGLTVEPLTIGALDVPALVRRVAGVESTGVESTPSGETS